MENTTMTQANIGYDTVFAIKVSGSFVPLAEVFEVTPPEVAIDQVEVTHFKSPGRSREYIPALSDNGTASANMNYVPNSATDVLLDTLKASGDVAEMRITYPNGVTITFDAFVSGYSKSIPVADRMTAEVQFKVSGAVVMAAAAAPTNTVLPAIAGTPEDGETLTAFEGIWTGSPAFTYQWQQDAAGNGTFANISGATSKTLALVTGNVGNAIRVIVTGTNAAGTASATSAATVVVAA
jgi:predicted secreted protein